MTQVQTTMVRKSIEQEWLYQQGQYDSYEKYALLIKLTSITLTSAMVLMQQGSLYWFALLSVLWLQEAIWKTFQGRISQRLLTLETAIQQGDNGKVIAFTYNQAFASTRGGSYSLIREYAMCAIKPTVAFPHIVVVLISLHAFYIYYTH